MGTGFRASSSPGWQPPPGSAHRPPETTASSASAVPAAQRAVPTGPGCWWGMLCAVPACARVPVVPQLRHSKALGPRPQAMWRSRLAGGCEHEEEAEGPAPQRGPPLAAAWLCLRGSNLESQLPRPPALPARGLSDVQCADVCASGHVTHGKGDCYFHKTDSPPL